MHVFQYPLNVCRRHGCIHKILLFWEVALSVACSLKPLVASSSQLKPWKMEPGDTALLDLLPLLEQIFRTNVTDVRAVVRSFDGQVIFCRQRIVCSSLMSCMSQTLSSALA